MSLIRGFGSLSGSALAFLAPSRGITVIAYQCERFDVWRYPTLMDRGYTHYFTVHDIHLRIDYRLVACSLMTPVQHCEHLSQTYSDYSPVLIMLELDGLGPLIFSWRFPQ
ncbi:hypothetical protein NDU88_005613 [Pleurodeles waltl]|uniref:Uncharacterized protein n=1 Tax=Pleurodeles waltl TaxID=8319 RepID=A0AAV7UJS2_PLEWA|nr:hypothetical protein NDU88_005613 [Pleurodeles waltl]